MLTTAKLNRTIEGLEKRIETLEDRLEKLDMFNPMGAAPFAMAVVRIVCARIPDWTHVKRTTAEIVYHTSYFYQAAYHAATLVNAKAAALVSANAANPSDARNHYNTLRLYVKSEELGDEELVTYCVACSRRNSVARVDSVEILKKLYASDKELRESEDVANLGWVETMTRFDPSFTLGALK